FGVGVRTRTQHHHEQRGWPDLAADWIVYRDRGSGPVDRILLAGLVFLAKNHILLLAPPPVEFAETTVAVSFRMHLSILFPSQLQRQVGDAAATARAGKENSEGLARESVLPDFARRIPL